MHDTSKSAVHPFAYQSSGARKAETLFFVLFRLATYAILAFAAFIFLTIIWKGAPTVFSSQFPFINTTFLFSSPETLHVFKNPQGEVISLGEKEFRVYETAHKDTAETDIQDHQTYAYSAGGIFPCIVGTALLVIGSIIIALILGVTSAVYLSEYSKKSRSVEIIRLSILNLAGVPSIVFGLFGFALFVLVAPIVTTEPSASAFKIPLYLGGAFLSFQGWNTSLLAGWFTLAFMILPVIITASEESLRSIPQGFREGSLALGATKWQSIWTNVLPYALPGILTSCILGIARVAGETAPIMYTAAYVVSDRLPWEGSSNPFHMMFQGVMALPYHIYVLSAKIPQSEYTERVQYGTVFVFLAIVMCFALGSVLLRLRMRKLYKW